MKKKNLMDLILLVIFFVLTILIIIQILKYVKQPADKTYILIHESIIDNKGNTVYSSPHNIFYIYDNGNHLARNVGKVDLYSPKGELIWSKEYRVHHEIEKGEDNNIYILTRENRTYNEKEVEFDKIVKLSENGSFIDEWDTFENLDEIQRLFDSENYTVKYNKRGVFDYFHANSIDYIPKNANDDDPRFQEGNLIISLSHVELIVILDKNSKEIVWHWGPGELEFMHTPRMLRNGNIIIFENGALEPENKRNYSRIIELDPVKKEIVWEYKADPPESFYSSVKGSVQELPNNNLLVCEAMAGHVFEIDKNKTIIWETYVYVNSTQKDELYRASYVPKEIVDILLNNN